MHSRTLVLVMILVALGSLFFLVQPDPPELERVMSNDGVLRVEVLASEASNLSVTTVPGSASTARVSPIYEVSAVSLVGELGATVSLTSPLGSSEHLLAVWDSNHLAWVPLRDTQFRNGVFSGGVLLPGKVSLVQLQDVDIPHRYEQIVAELIENRPEKTDRAFINLSYAFEPEDYVLIRSARVTAACGGDLRAPRGSTEVEEVVEPITLSVNGNEREGWIRVVANWELEDGCTEDENFELIQ